MKLLKPEDTETFKKLDLKQPYVWLATWFGFGFFRPGPGTWGSIGAIPPALALFLLGGIKGFIGGLIFLIAIGFWAARHFDKATGGHDNSMIVIDEAAGQWIAMIPALYFVGMNAFLVFFSLVLFRFFDILKPWPISWVDKSIKGAAGVMLDDILAGLIAALILTGVIFYAGFG
ncbi:MAG: phosphatidylglycerophosphatase A [Alphaproteobacteria bacterium]|nr:phosphatidylglycerophosphatase A [Alphaproteobacteria bacterium]